MKRTSARAFLSAVAAQKKQKPPEDPPPEDSNTSGSEVPGHTEVAQVARKSARVKKDAVPSSVPIPADVRTEDDADYEINYISASDEDDSYDVLISDSEDTFVRPKGDIIDLDDGVPNSVPSANSLLSTADTIFYTFQTDEVGYSLEFPRLTTKTLIIHGQCSLRVLRGSISLYGAQLNASPHFHDVFAPSCHALPILTGVTARDPDPEDLAEQIAGLVPEGLEDSLTALLQFPTIVAVRALKTGLEDIGNIWPNFKKVWPKTFETGASLRSLPALIVPPEWEKELAAITADAAPRRVTMICGPKSAGKSTFARLLLNSIVTKSSGRVAYLDLDPGQPEFGPPGVISLCVLDSPVLGPPFTHGTLSAAVKACHFGYSTPRDAPHEYLAQVRLLMAQYLTQLSDMPLLINTTGWTKGQGVQVLQDILTASNASTVVYIGQPLGQLDLDTNFELARVLHGAKASVRQLLPVPTDQDKIGRYSAADLRALQMAAYFHLRGARSWDFGTFLTHVRPYAVPYTRDLIIDISNGEGILDEHILTAINGTIVGISTVDREVPVRDANGLAVLHSKHTAGIEPSCLGLGIVRAVDTKSEILHVLTPVPPKLILDAMARGNKILLSRGRLELPLAIAWNGDQMGVCGRPWRDVPFLAMDEPVAGGDSVVGAQSLRVRRNIMRRSHHVRE